MQATNLKYVAIAIALLFTIPTYAAKAWRGDVDGDGKLTLSDLTQMIKLLNSGQNATTLLTAKPTLDVDKDGKFGINDIHLLAQILIGKVKPDTINIGGGFTDEDQDNPSDGPSASGGFKDNEQSSPGTSEGGGGFKDEDMSDPDKRNG